MIVELTWSGHYPPKFVEISDEEWERVKTLASTSQYLFDTEEGRALIRAFDGRPAVKVEVPPRILCYV